MDPLGAHDPKRVGPYRLLGRLGAGGMGQVFLGADRRDELVAIKVVHPGLAHDAKFRSRFRREVEISRRVTGPWVAAVVDADPDAPTPWLATQYVRGPTLGTAVEALGPLAAGTVHVLAHGLAIALSAVHEAVLVHRDLKPSNVLLGSDHPRLIDFGISRAIDGTRVTSTGVVIGTPAFMSPEQIAGEKVGPASDVFSLGSVLAYAATGRSPFGDHPPVVLMMRISGHDPDLDGVPDVLREPIAACLAKRPEDRPTAAELSELLGPVAAGGSGWLPAEVAALGTDPDGPTVPHAGTRVMTDVPAPAKAPWLSRRGVLVGLGAIGLTAAGGFALAAAFSTPRQRWTVPVVWQGEVAAAALDGSTLYLYSHNGDGTVAALDTATGAQRWSVPGWAHPAGIGDEVGMVPVGETLVIGTETVVAALGTAAGLRRWEMPRSVDPLHSAGMAVTDGVAVATTVDGLVALDVGTGGRLWTASLGHSAKLADVAAHNGMCFSWNGAVIDARDLRTGRQLWSFRPNDYSSLGRLVAAGDVVVGGNSAGTPQVIGMDRGTGRQRWNVTLGSSATSLRSLIIVGDVLVAYASLETDVTDGGVLHGFDLATGLKLWSQSEPEWDIATTLVGVDEIVYVSPQLGSQYAYDVATGVRRWAYEPSPRDFYTLIAARGRDVYLHGQGQVQALTIT